MTVPGYGEGSKDFRTAFMRSLSASGFSFGNNPDLSTPGLL